jgi:hypothetical protein
LAGLVGIVLASAAFTYKYIEVPTNQRLRNIFSMKLGRSALK